MKSSNCGNIEDIVKENIELKSRLNKLRELRDEIELFREKERILSIVKIGVWIYNIEKRTIKLSQEFLNILGIEVENTTLNIEEFTELVDFKNPQSFLEKLKNIETQHIFPFDEIVYIEGKPAILNFNGDILEDNLKSSKVIGSVQNVTELRENQQGLENSNRKLKKFINLVDEYVITYEFDLEYKVTNASDAFKRLYKYSDEELQNCNFLSLIDDYGESSVAFSIMEKLKRKKTWTGEIYKLNKEGKKIWIKANISPDYDQNLEIIGFSVIGEDITNLKKLESMSVEDELTGLHNRRYYNQVISKEISRVRRSGENMTFLMIDIDHFKQYNDTYGHAEGDVVLKAIGKVFKESLHRGEDYAFRLGGEEFGVLFSGADTEQSLNFANILRERIEDLKIPHIKNSVSDYVTASMGVLVVDLKHNVADEHTIYTTADSALYKAKELGRNRCFLHEEEELDLF